MGDEAAVLGKMASPADAAINADDPFIGPKPLRKRFILCFDGTGNKFQGNEGDSNILKIYSMLDKSDGSQYHYYQPGIGTYTTRSSLSSNGMISRLSSWYNKAKDSAVGTTVDEHVMSGYRFLMRYYTTGDDIYFFGFSRGSYVARFLGELLDHVGLLSAGNEELVRFVWKTFAKWQERQGGNSEEERKNAAEMLKFMKAFRETFSRPVRRIRFLGLFDTVNSVSKFEGAWMQRSKFPYTARSSALMIRHAVAIDERRAKFRQDLLSQKREKCPGHISNGNISSTKGQSKRSNGAEDKPHDKPTRFKKPGGSKMLGPASFSPDRFRSHSRGRSRTKYREESNGQGHSHSASNASAPSSFHRHDPDYDSDDSDENAEQDLEEVWFPGCHADIGGGWPPDEPEKLALSHVPLVWMVREAQKAGLIFVPETMKALNCYYDEDAFTQSTPSAMMSTIPQIELNDAILPTASTPPDTRPSTAKQPIDQSPFLDLLERSSTRGHIHDCLSFGQGLPPLSVLSWRLMEYLPFRRMDLQRDGSWKAIRWPLPMGETRDVPDGVMVHNSVIQRMRADASYRPGNLIVGGGGRGMRVAPRKAGMGEWVVLKEEGHPVAEVWVKKRKETKGTIGEK